MSIAASFTERQGTNISRQKGIRSGIGPRPVPRLRGPLIQARLACPPALPPALCNDHERLSDSLGAFS